MTNQDSDKTKLDEVSRREAFLIKLYGEVCTNIRTSDDISFKLLSFVPLLSSSGAAILTIAKTGAGMSSVAIIILSLTAATITFGLFKWELRNVQKCEWLIDRAAALENLEADLETLADRNTVISQFHGWDDLERPPLFGKLSPIPNRNGAKVMPAAETAQGENRPWYKRAIGKTQAERIVYWASIIAWLAPVAMASIRWS